MFAIVCDNSITTFALTAVHHVLLLALRGLVDQGMHALKRA